MKYYCLGYLDETKWEGMSESDVEETEMAREAPDELATARGEAARAIQEDPEAVFAGLSEVGWAVGLKYTEGFTRLVPSMLTIASMVVSLGLLGLALKTLPLGTAYAIWTGIGTIGTALLGIMLFGESASALRLACIALIVAGIVGLKLVPVE